MKVVETSRRMRAGFGWMVRFQIEHEGGVCGPYESLEGGMLFVIRCVWRDVLKGSGEPPWKDIEFVNEVKS